MRVADAIRRWSIVRCGRVEADSSRPTDWHDNIQRSRRESASGRQERIARGIFATQERRGIQPGCLSSSIAASSPGSSQGASTGCSRR